MENKGKLLSIKKVADMLGVHEDTVRRWGDEGTLEMVRTSGGHRRYPLRAVEKMLGVNETSPLPLNTVAVYCRVSSHDQKKKGDLDRQVGRVTTYCVGNGYTIISVLQDVGSGMNDSRSKLLQLFSLVEDKKINKVVVEHKDRLSRFGFGLLERYFGSHGVSIEWTQETLGKSYEEELVEDIISLMASFSARIYGRRSAQNRKNKVDRENV